MIGRRFVATKLFIVLMLLFALAGCTSNRRVEEGFVEVTGGKIWYRMVGNGHGTPLIVVPGGPGLPHQYLRSLEELSDERPIVFYDPLGSGRSDRPADDKLWTPYRFAMEIDALRDHLELANVYVLADSWGAVTGSEYLLLQPAGVRGAIFTSPVFSGPRYIADAERLLDQLPRQAKQTIRKHEHDLTTGAPDFRSAFQQFSDRFICRAPKPPEFGSAIANVGVDSHRVLHGSNEIEINGTLRNYDRVAEFDQIKIPVLLTCGRFDVVPPETAALYQTKLNTAKLAVFQQSSHMPIYEEPEAFMKTLRDFLRDHDAR